MRERDGFHHRPARPPRLAGRARWVRPPFVSGTALCIGTLAAVEYPPRERAPDPEKALAIGRRSRYGDLACLAHAGAGRGVEPIGQM